MPIIDYRTAPSRVPMPKTTIATSQTVFDGGGHFDLASTNVPPEQSAEPSGRSACLTQDAPLPGELERILHDALAKAGSAELRRIRVRIEGSDVLLVGQVSSYYLKQLAQEAMRRFIGKMQICNCISVDGHNVDGRRLRPR